jgi:hypothetical protein
MAVIVVSKRAVDAARAEVEAMQAVGLTPSPEIVELAQAKPRRADPRTKRLTWTDMSLEERRRWAQTHGHDMTPDGALVINLMVEPEAASWMPQESFGSAAERRA